jgi:hypothetical protein
MTPQEGSPRQGVGAYPVRFRFDGAERCLTLDEAGALMSRIGAAIKVACDEIHASAVASLTGDTGTDAHHPMCDVNDLSPSLGPSQKPCNCRGRT